MAPAGEGAQFPWGRAEWIPVLEVCMAMQSRFLAWVLPGLASLACQATTAPQRLPVELDTTTATGVLPATIAAVGDRVIVRGRVGTPDPCYRFSAVARIRSDTLDLRLEAQSMRVICIQVVGSHPYELTVRAVPPGTWRVRLDYALEGWPALTRLVESSITVR